MVSIAHGYKESMGNSVEFESTVLISDSLWNILSFEDKVKLIEKCAFINRPPYADCWSNLKELSDA